MTKKPNSKYLNKTLNYCGKSEEKYLRVTFDLEKIEVRSKEGYMKMEQWYKVQQIKGVKISNKSLSYLQKLPATSNNNSSCFWSSIVENDQHQTMYDNRRLSQHRKTFKELTVRSQAMLNNSIFHCKKDHPTSKQESKSVTRYSQHKLLNASIETCGNILLFEGS